MKVKLPSTPFLVGSDSQTGIFKPCLHAGIDYSLTQVEDQAKKISDLKVVCADDAPID